MKSAYIFAGLLLSGVAPSFSETIIEPAKISYPHIKNNLGKEFYIEKDHPFLSTKRGNMLFSDNIASFVKSPDLTQCSIYSDKCNAIPIKQRMKFRVDAIVMPEGPPVQKENKYQYPEHVSDCFYRVTFQDSSVAYIRYENFDSASSSSGATTLGFPGLFSIEQTPIPKGYRDTRAAMQRKFKKEGIKRGYTQEEVLMSNWGQPASKSRSIGAYGTMEIWLYRNGMVQFTNDVATEIAVYD